MSERDYVIAKALRDTATYKNAVWDRDMVGHPGAKSNRSLQREYKGKILKPAAVGMLSGAALGAAASAGLARGNRKIAATVGGVVGGSLGQDIGLTTGVIRRRKAVERDPRFIPNPTKSARRKSENND